MKHAIERDIDNDDDRRDPIAQTLRDQARSARMKPSTALRNRTLDTLRSPPAALPLPSKRNYNWRLILAAAAMIALAVTVSSVWNPLAHHTSDGVVSRGNPVAPASPPTVDGNRRPAFASNASAQLASLTRPLEREAEALQSDLKRISNRVRNALPGKNARQPAPASQSQPALSPSL